MPPTTWGLTLTEAFFTTQVNKPPTDTTGAASKQTNLRDAKIRLREDCTIEVQGKASAYGFLVPIEVVVQPRVVNGRIEMKIVKGQAGGLTVPASVADDVQTVIGSPDRQYALQEGFSGDLHPAGTGDVGGAPEMTAPHRAAQ